MEGKDSNDPTEGMLRSFDIYDFTFSDQKKNKQNVKFPTEMQIVDFDEIEQQELSDDSDRELQEDSCQYQYWHQRQNQKIKEFYENKKNNVELIDGLIVKMEQRINCYKRKMKSIVNQVKGS